MKDTRPSDGLLRPIIIQLELTIQFSLIKSLNVFPQVRWMDPLDGNKPWTGSLWAHLDGPAGVLQDLHLANKK